MAKYNATFTSVWDGGIEVNSRCYASKRKHLITRFGKNDIGNGDMYLENLDDEYVTLDTGEQYKACSIDEMESYEENGVEVFGY